MSETSKKIHNLTLSTYVDFWNFSLSTNQEIRRNEELKNLDRYAFGQVMWNKKKAWNYLEKFKSIWTEGRSFKL